VPRVKLRCGDRHNEMTGGDHVWCIIASYIEKKHRRRRAQGIVVEDDDQSLNTADSSSVIPGRSNTMIIFRSVKSVLSNVKSTFLSWIPWYSVAFSQRSRLTFSTAKLKAAEDEIEPPHLNIHIFDKYGTENL
jgi:hypothetical protein